MKKLTATFLILTVASFVVIFGCAKEPKEIKIGALLPLTGAAALYGQNAREGIDLAVEEINQEEGVLGNEIRIVYEDTQGDPKITVSAFQKLVRIDKIQAVIGTITSSALLAIAPIADEEEVVILSPAATSPKVTDAGEFIFRNWPSDTYEGQIMAQYAYHDLRLKKVSLLIVNNDYGKGVEEVFAMEFQRLGGTIGAVETFNQKDTDFRTQISKTKDGQPDAVYMIGYPEEFVNILRQIREIGFKVTLLSAAAFQDMDIIEKAGEAAEGVIYPYPVEPAIGDPVVKSFSEGFERKYGKKPGIVCDTGYDALKMIVSAMRSENSTEGSEIQRGLTRIRDFHGASGVMSFDENGDVEKTMEMKTVRDGEFVKIQ